MSGDIKNNNLTVHYVVNGFPNEVAVGLRRNDKLMCVNPVLILGGAARIAECDVWDHVQGLRFQVRDAWTAVADKEGLWA